jgi:hypothetical protein
MTLKRRLARLEAALPPVASAVDQETLRMKVRFMAELAGQGPKESPAEAIARLLEYDTPRQMTDAMRHDIADFRERWGQALRRHFANHSG